MAYCQRKELVIGIIIIHCYTTSTDCPLVTSLFTVLCCVCYTGESTFEVKIEIKTEADVSDDKPRPYLCSVCDKRFTTKQRLTRHTDVHTTVVYTCSSLPDLSLPTSSLLQADFWCIRRLM